MCIYSTVFLLNIKYSRSEATWRIAILFVVLIIENFRVLNRSGTSIPFVIYQELCVRSNKISSLLRSPLSMCYLKYAIVI